METFFVTDTLLWTGIHAEAGWGEGTTSDHERPLTEKGLNDAGRQGIVLRVELDQVEQVYVSSSKRAQETANQLKIESDKRNDRKEFYNFDANELIKLISKLDDSFDYIQIIAHNPAITEVVNYKSDAFLPNVTPAGMVLLEWSGTSSWEETVNQEAAMIWYKVP